MNRLLVAAVALGMVSQSAAAAEIVIGVPEPAAAEGGFLPDWTGVSIGGFGGYGWSDAAASLVGTSGAIAGAPLGIDASGDGAISGVSLGGDVAFRSGLVLGVLADAYGAQIDADGSALSAVPSPDTPLTQSAEQNWGFDLVARAGLLVDPRALVYVLGGYGYADVDWRTRFDGATSGRGDAGLDGWTIGGGIEAIVLPNLSVKAEYRFTDFEAISIDGTSTGGSYDGRLDLDTHRLLFGVNWRPSGP
ncbi:outer membrane protein [Prosthecomicrobium pneumaticum]|uniref:Outer membrane immunogenic protein n=1 Tax=Prosthecomicrobium pneumaticum TaxID=81895 RepID=A0A7W9FMT8_9HYPH|nr:outer membrane beta-barrel protein [Prosthecomicrobium pneumaticum]MBB5753597.1 outer membrane immunogenic protein [Prosthecomicrobium pneumaticum]